MLARLRWALVLAVAVVGAVSVHAAELGALALRLAPTLQSPVLPEVPEVPSPSATSFNPALPDFSSPSRAGCPPLAAERRLALTLMDVVAQVLCQSPGFTQALLLVDEQQAGVDLARAAFRPSFSANAELASNRIPSSNSGSPSLSASGTGSLGMSWVLLDAGARAATLEQSRQLFSAARAGQQTAVLNAANEALRLYVEAATAASRLESTQQTESVARQSLQVAQGRYDAQVAPLAEKLQASTALAQATLERVRADGAWSTSRGLLALAMGLSVQDVLGLAPLDAAFPAGTALMTDAAVEEHPRLRGARAAVLALKSRLDAVRAEGKGSVSLAIGAGSTRDLATSGGRFEHSVSGSVLASIPLFNRTEQQARESQVQAQVASGESALEQVRRDVEADLWRNARLLDTESQNLVAADVLLQTAGQSFQITLGRYKAGVGSMLELLATQAALANARAQQTQARLGLEQARLRLHVASGRMLLKK